MDELPRPSGIVWDTTYACGLRCAHCYSESGRRPSKQLAPDDLLTVGRALASLKPTLITISGGDPPLVKGLMDVAEQLAEEGAPLGVYGSGWVLPEDFVTRLANAFQYVSISVDGATAQRHDTIRGRKGSFDRAMAAVARIDAEASRLREPFHFGVDFTVLRSNFDEMPDFVRLIGDRFPSLRAISFAAAVPSGYANRESFAARELLTEDQLDQLRDPAFRRRLQAAAPSWIEVSTSDNFEFMAHPDYMAANPRFQPMQVESDGEVRGLLIYEGTVGNLLEEPAEVLWERTLRRRNDPFAVETLRPVRTMAQWAEAARVLDRHYGSPETLDRIARRPEYAG